MKREPRLWRLLEWLQERSFGPDKKFRGANPKQIETFLGVSRATIFRYLKLLADLGIPLVKETVNGETRYKLEENVLPSLRLTPRQIEALQLARKRMEVFRGVQVFEDLDELLSKICGPLERTEIDARDVPADTDEEAVRLADEALREGRQLEFHYTSANGNVGVRRVDPLLIWLKERHLFLEAYDVQKQELRTYKFLRMKEARVLEGRAASHPEFDRDFATRGAVKVWQAPLCDVVIQIAATKVRFVPEWPLHPNQQLSPQPDGSVIVRARVAGTQETLKWVQSWGSAAWVLEPPELRQAHLDELRAGLERYK